MALAVAGLKAEGQTEIDDAHAVNKTFPNFVSLMQSLGANMEVKNVN
jgi:3-phosphoshikimate 1-carboxyvinyltransferase